MLYDRAEKKRRGYVEKDSIVRQDGSEKLVGRDWKKRKEQLWYRCNGRCEFRYDEFLIEGGAIHRCIEEAHDPHHIMPRSKSRDDRLFNLQALCRYHHNLLDGRKIGGRK